MKKTEYILLFLILLPASFFLLKAGFYEPHDLHHFADIYQMYRAIASGQFPPRIGPDFIFGYGYPLFNVYYLFPFYLGAIFFAVSGSLQASFEFVFIIAVILSVFGMYLFLREFFTKWSSLVGTVLFLYTPYRAEQIYVRGAMGEALALSILPFVAWLIVLLIRKPENKKVLAITSLVTAIFILSHNYFWAITAPWLLLLIIGVITNKKPSEVILSIIGMGVLALGLSAYWWLPALIEQNMILSATPFPLIDHFPFIKQLILPSWGYGSSVWGPGDEISFQVGIVNWLVFLILAGLILFKKLDVNKQKSRLAIWAFIGFLASLFMMNVRSYPLWKMLPFHDFIQFPWRLLFLTTFFTSVMAALVVDTFKKYKNILGWLIIFSSLVLTVSYFRPSKLFYKSDNEYLTRFFANRAIEGEKNTISPEYLQYSEDYLLLPKWVAEKPVKLPGNKIESLDAEVSEVIEISPTEWSARVKSETGGKATFNSIYFPGWFAKVDGEDVEIKIGKPYGQIEIDVPTGSHDVEFLWAETPARKIADFTSFASLLIVGSLWYLGGKRNEEQ